MKTAIFQYYLKFNGIGKEVLEKHYPSEIPEWVKRSVMYFKHYAKIHNADYFFFVDRYINSISNFFESLRVIKDPLFDAYDIILYVDVDVIPKDFSKNIFDIEFIDVAGWPEWRHPDLAVPVNWSKSKALTSRFSDFNAPIIKPKTIQSSIRMINSGVVLWSKEARLRAREHFDDHEKWFRNRNRLFNSKLTQSDVGHSTHCLDQPYLNAMWNKFEFNVKELDIVWNRFPTKNEDRPCYFAHYVADYRFNIPKLFPPLENLK